MGFLARNTKSRVFVCFLVGIVCYNSLSFFNTNALQGSGTLSYNEYVSTKTPHIGKNRIIHWFFHVNDLCNMSVLLFLEEEFALFDAVINGSMSVNLNFTLLYSDVGRDAFADHTVSVGGVFIVVFFHNDPGYNDTSIDFFITFPEGENPTGKLSTASKTILIILGAILFFIISMAIIFNIGERTSKPSIRTIETVMKSTPEIRKEISFNCSECGEILEKGTVKCSACKEAVTCTICKLDLTFDEQTAKCPYCGCISHVEHIYEWLAIREKCPKCFKTLRITDLILIFE